MHRIDDDRADAWFHALSDRTRRDILQRVLPGEQSVSALARNYSMSLTAVQKHVAVLEGAGLITRRRRGWESLARGDAEPLRSASELLTELEAIQREHIARIDELLAAETDPASAGPTPTDPPHRKD
ncbi:MAG: helix-turn-helix domain-containing protein [Brachybacterium sp.]|uniref:ArsR/SmtB family transcription factor n=1 Tax=Brachybacterium sp. TaxID=1891286 RepID=UPI00264842AE|nr:helix-turn-helix domain-containing protein [Brachybacterium sp.]MDN5685329.1 helix-turn-helix domain-containing protein [Brachybacterium sp.]